ncbi:hypothetical protein SAMN05216228_10516 [Rhizobium tibeticum]|uniref:Uncharacterized protein n=1 Tax=Rhizobium tibeticum TaxID=501024 RepID=A0A1H8W1C0_9HYPH|nr:hypothetical protein RTCCBAU85039_6254 [Rhizobium tibeticum]SEP21395.1 hypothetical protein SAMN05216228_10516 [Rhizobium tibeticum]
MNSLTEQAITTARPIQADPSSLGTETAKPVTSSPHVGTPQSRNADEGGQHGARLSRRLIKPIAKVRGRKLGRQLGERLDPTGSLLTGDGSGSTSTPRRSFGIPV